MTQANRESLIDLLRQVQEAMVNGMREASEGFGASTIEETLQRLAGTQTYATRLMQAMTAMWQALANEGITDTDGLNAFMEGLRSDFFSEESAASFQPFAEQWRASMDGPATDWATSPGFGFTRGYQAKMGALLSAWLEVLQRDLEYRSVLSGAWFDAFGRFMTILSKRATDGEPSLSARETMVLWVETADEVFVEAFRSEAYTTAQAALMNASMTLKKQRRVVMEDMLVAYDLPTRTQVDEAHRMIYELRKEMKALRRQLKQRGGNDGDR